jgi:steroid 5-alpha reductase family enzyme
MLTHLFVDTYLQLCLIIWIYFSVVYVIALVKKRNDVADIAWGFGFIVVTAYSYFSNGIAIDRGLIVLILIVVWGSRLSLHIFLRNRLKTEDYRYKTWRESWGKHFYWRSYVQVFLLQGVLLLVVATPAVVSEVSCGMPLTYLDFIGIFVWLFGFLFESIADKQLAIFSSLADNKGKVIQHGLWRYSRHPNYFGEVTQWWGIAIIALSVPAGVVGILGAATITFLILKVSGVPMLEAKMKQNPAFVEYAKKTSVFFPMPPKK